MSSDGDLPPLLTTAGAPPSRPARDASAPRARRRLDPTDVRLRRARRLQLARRACLAASFGFAVVVPLAHAAANAVDDGRAAAGLPRPPLLGAPWSVSLFGLELTDPLALASLAAAGAGAHALAAAALGALPVIALVMLLGRYFCAWLCPYAVVVAVSNAARSILRKAGVPLLDVRLPRATAFVVLAALLAASAVAGFALAPLVYPPAIAGRALWSFAAFGSAGAGAVVVVALFAFDTFVSRAGFCRSLCPGGAMFRALSVLSPVRVRRTPARCTDCGVCDAVCNMGESPMTDAVDAGCDRCARCVSSCPTGALDLVAIGRPRRRGPTP